MTHWLLPSLQVMKTHVCIVWFPGHSFKVSSKTLSLAHSLLNLGLMSGIRMGMLPRSKKWYVNHTVFKTAHRMQCVHISQYRAERLDGGPLCCLIMQLFETLLADSLHIMSHKTRNGTGPLCFLIHRPAIQYNKPAFSRPPE